MNDVDQQVLIPGATVQIAPDGHYLSPDLTGQVLGPGDDGRIRVSHLVVREYRPESLIRVSDAAPEWGPDETALHAARLVMESLDEWPDLPRDGRQARVQKIILAALRQTRKAPVPTFTHLGNQEASGPETREGIGRVASALLDYLTEVQRAASGKPHDTDSARLLLGQSLDGRDEVTCWLPQTIKVTVRDYGR